MSFVNLPNGLRYPLVGGTRQRHFDGTNFEPRKMLENAQTPRRPVHALLAASYLKGHKCIDCFYPNLGFFTTKFLEIISKFAPKIIGQAN